MCHLHTLSATARFCRSCAASLLLLWLICAPTLRAAAADTTPPHLVFNSISVQLDNDGRYVLTSQDILNISAGSTDNVAIANRTVTPIVLNFCDVPAKPVMLTLTDSSGNATNYTGNITVLAPTNHPSVVYVSAGYGGACTVALPNSAGTAYLGFNAFRTVQAAINAVAEHGTVYVAAGTYIENVTVDKPLSLLGPNSGVPGFAGRAPEAEIIPALADPEDTPIIAVISSDVVVDGFLLDGYNPALSAVDGYTNSIGVAGLFAAAGVQNGVYPDLYDVSNLTIANNLIRNISYDGVYLDRVDFSATPSTGNFILNNKFEDMWEGVLTYAAHAVIANNTMTNVNRGLSVHGTITGAGSFVPAITNNQLTVAQWWPSEVARQRAVGIWINYRRLNAAPLWVADNTVDTPSLAPVNKIIRGLEALTIDGNGTMVFARNTIEGHGNCQQGIYASACWSNLAVQVLGGSIHNAQTGVLVDTKDPDWGAGDALLTVSNLTFQSDGSGAAGIVVLQDSETPTNRARVDVLGNCSIRGYSVGVSICGTKASASLLNNGSIGGNRYGVEVLDGKALLEKNDLTGNAEAAIHVIGGGLVDAGDCSGAGITGLGTGSGPGGSSAGLNHLSGYGCDNRSPWAIENLGTGLVKAQQNNFGAAPGDPIAAAFNGAVDFSLAGGAFIICPGPLTVPNIVNLPEPATTVADFLAAGGSVSAVSATLSVSNYPAHPGPGDTVVYRTYSITDPCGHTASATQTITVPDQPSLCLPGFTQLTRQPVLSVNGSAGMLYAIRATTNFVHWDVLITNRAPYTFTDTGAASMPYRFYQVFRVP